MRAERLPRFLRWQQDWPQRGRRAVAVLAPMGLEEDAVDLLEIDEADLVAHGFEQRAQAEVAGAAQQAFTGTDEPGPELPG